MNKEKFFQYIFLTKKEKEGKTSTKTEITIKGHSEYLVAILIISAAFVLYQIFA